MAGSDGRVPLRIRIGVTGHRTLHDEPAVAARVDDVLARLRDIAPSTSTTPVLYEVVSPLGEGADRIVADRVLAVPSAILEVPLPLPPKDYERDFGTEESRGQFAALLARAERTWVVGGADRIDAYRLAGEYVVDSCDALIAIWDGEPSRGSGGTADILELARRREMPVFVIDARPPYSLHEDRVPARLGLLREVGTYDAVVLPAHGRAGASLLPAGVELSGEEGSDLERCRAWVQPAFRRAEILAARCHVRFRWASRLMFLMSALAVLAVALSIAAGETGLARALVSLEVGFMIAALVLWLLIRRRLHSRWITARFLSERLRSAAFLAFVGSGDGIEPKPEGEYLGNAQEWLTRVYREVWRSRPRLERQDREVEQVRSLLDDGWVHPQLLYYRRRGRSHAGAYRGLTAVSAFLFAATIVAAALHASDLVHGTVSKTIVVLSVALPAFAGALTGIAALEQHERHAERFHLMDRRLGELSDRLRGAPDLDRVRRTAMRIEGELRTETDAWIDVMRFQDVDLPV